MCESKSSRQGVVRVIVITAGLVVFILLAYKFHRHEIWPIQHSTLCRERLKQIALALNTYHDQHQRFPPAFTVGSDGRRWHSWRALILPQLGEQELYDEYRFDEPWDGEHNSKLHARMPDVFGYDNDSSAKFLAVTGQYTAWPGESSSRIREFVIGTSNSIMLVESEDSGVNWLEPKDIPLAQALERRRAPEAPRMAGRVNAQTAVALADGQTRMFADTVDEYYLKTSLRVGPTGETKRPPQASFPSLADAATLPGTDVYPVTSLEIQPARNYLYCATARIGWDRLRPDAGLPVVMNSNSPLVGHLNSQPFATQNLDPNSYFVGIAQPHNFNKLKAQLRSRFPGSTAPASITKSSRKNSFVIFGHLLKSLSFADAFDGHTKPLTFPNGSDETSGSRVATFGGTEGYSQVHVADYRTDEDFIIELKTESAEDQLLLAKIPPAKTLQKTIDRISERVASPNPLHKRFSLEWEEELLIPKISFNIHKGYEGLTGPIAAKNGVSDDPIWIERMEQSTAFVLDERGAVLESTFETFGFIGEFGDELPPPPPKVRTFHFDKPFLVLLRQRNSTEPYFAVWLANSELMIPTSY